MFGIALLIVSVLCSECSEEQDPKADIIKTKEEVSKTKLFTRSVDYRYGLKSCCIIIKALASARGSEKLKKIRKNPKKIKKIVPAPIYVFVDSEQKAEFKAKI